MAPSAARPNAGGPRPRRVIRLRRRARRPRRVTRTTATQKLRLRAACFLPGDSLTCLPLQGEIFLSPGTLPVSSTPPPAVFVKQPIPIAAALRRALSKGYGPADLRADV